MLYKKIVIKVGTNVICTEDKSLDKVMMKNIVDQIVFLRQKGIDIVFVSSGAVGAAKSFVKLSSQVTAAERRQILSSVGQPRLMNEYQNLFSESEFLCSQILVTKSDFRDREHYLNMHRCFNALLSHDIVPIVNENDSVTVDDLMFTDNDELASLIASMIEAEALIILTSVDGIFDGDPKDSKSKLVSEIDICTTNVSQYISSEKSSLGRGGMSTKSHIAEKIAKLGIATHIINGRKQNILVDLLQGKSLGTTFKPLSVKSQRKRWIANCDGYEKGIVVIMNEAEKVLRSQHVSLLPIGIIEVFGDFKEKDFVKVRNISGQDLGIGVASYDASTLKKIIGKKNEKTFIHYDNLVLF